MSTINGAKYADQLGPIPTRITRRRLIASAIGGASMSIGDRFAMSEVSALRFDFSKPLDGWTTVSGKWERASKQ
jgi:hypothetical protein